MSEIVRKVAPAKTHAFRRYGNVVETLAQLFVSGNDDCVIFLGAGASIDATHPSPPTASQLSRTLADACKLEWPEYVPLSTIAYYFEFYRRREDLNRFLLEAIARPEITPSTTIRHLMRIVRILEATNRDVLVVTTNYDQQFEKAYRDAFGRDPTVLVYNGGTDANDRDAKLHVGLERDIRAWKPSTRTFLYKMHGCISKAQDHNFQNHNLVVTEEDYINFLANAMSTHDQKRLLPMVLGKIAESSVLFIGYGLADWNFRVIFKATAEEHRKNSFTRSYAVQLFDHTLSNDDDDRDETRWEVLVNFWGEKGVDIINVDAEVFAKELADKVEELSKKAGVSIVSDALSGDRTSQ